MMLTHAQINALLLIKDAIELDAHKHQAHSSPPIHANDYAQALAALELPRLHGHVDREKLLSEIGKAGHYYHTRAELILELR